MALPLSEGFVVDLDGGGCYWGGGCDRGDGGGGGKLRLCDF